MRRKLCRPWTEEDIEQLRTLAAAKWSAGRIGARLKRSPRVVKIRALLNGISLAADKREVVIHPTPPVASCGQSEQENA